MMLDIYTHTVASINRIRDSTRKSESDVNEGENMTVKLDQLML